MKNQIVRQDVEIKVWRLRTEENQKKAENIHAKLGFKQEIHHLGKSPKTRYGGITERLPKRKHTEKSRLIWKKIKLKGREESTVDSYSIVVANL